jgi:hypothetical protein|tara:strand:- start:44 stop:424 length:381 start_codon:yes stop_codon:yes gene_type:complete
MSYLEIPITAVNGQTKYVIAKDKILFARQGDATLPVAGAVGTTVTLFLINPQGTFDTVVFTHTVLSAAVIAAGFNVADIINEAIASNPGGIVSKVGGIPATLSVTAPGVIGGQALTFVAFSAPVIA